MRQVTIKVGNTIKIKNLPPHLIPTIRQQLIIENPMWLENEKHKRTNHGVPKKLRFISKDSKTVPRGFLNELRKIFKEAKVDYRIRRSTISNPITIESKISFESRLYGKKAVDRILQKRFGVLQAPTGSGKTVIAIETICERKEKTLIVVHTKELLHQWVARLLEHSNITKDDIGLIGDGKKTVGKVTVGIINSLRNISDKEPEFFDKVFGYVVVDECHRIPSSTFSEFIINLDTKYMLGLSATPYRRDGLDLVIRIFMGDIIHKINTKTLQREGHILKAKLTMIKTRFSPYIDREIETGSNYQIIMRKLIEDEERNKLIIDNVCWQSSMVKGIALVVSDRKEHCRILFDKIPHKKEMRLLTGDSSPAERKLITEELNEGKVTILVATAQLIGEGYDVKHLSSVFLTTPIKYEGKLVQLIGRVLRTADGKEEAMIFDFNDPCYLLRGSYNSRLKSYKSMGVKK
jgi:superfamily II DNA or RNA helicase